MAHIERTAEVDALVVRQQLAGPRNDPRQYDDLAGETIAGSRAPSCVTRQG